MDPDKKEYHLSVALPGVDPKEIELYQHGITSPSKASTKSPRKEGRRLSGSGVLIPVLSAHDHPSRRCRRTETLGRLSQRSAGDYRASEGIGAPKQIEIKTGEKEKEKGKTATV